MSGNVILSTSGRVNTANERFERSVYERKCLHAWLYWAAIVAQSRSSVGAVSRGSVSRGSSVESEAKMKFLGNQRQK
jgi:hypothetical protein